MIGIYKIENKVNGKVYVGQSINIEQRFKFHERLLRQNKHENIYLQRSYNKYGSDAFNYIIIEECTEDKLNEREMYWIDYYKSYVGFDNSNGYNLTLGGEGTKMIHPVLQFDRYGNFIKEYDNGIIASKETNINVSAIYGCCIKRLKKAGGYIWLYKENYKDSNSLSFYLNSNRQCPINQYDINGTLIKQWDSCGQIIKETSINPIECLIHRKNTVKEYVWRYINDIDDLDDEYFAYIRRTSGRIFKKTILQFSTDNQLIQKYNSANEVQKYGHHKTMVRNAIKNNRIYHNSYWKYDVS